MWSQKKITESETSCDACSLAVANRNASDSRTVFLKNMHKDNSVLDILHKQRKKQKLKTPLAAKAPAIASEQSQGITKKDFKQLLVKVSKIEKLLVTLLSYTIFFFIFFLSFHHCFNMFNFANQKFTQNFFDFSFQKHFELTLYIIAVHIFL